MKHLARAVCLAAALCGAALALSACADSTLNKITTTLNVFDHSVDNFNAAAARIDQSIAKTSSSLAHYCSAAVTTGQNLSPLAAGNSTARAGLQTLTAGITSWCQAPPQDIGSAVAGMAKAVADATAAYKQAKAGG